MVIIWVSVATATEAMQTLAKIVAVVSTALAAATVPRVGQNQAGAILKVFQQAIFYPTYCEFTGMRRTRLETGQCDQTLADMVEYNGGFESGCNYHNEKAKIPSNEINEVAIVLPGQSGSESVAMTTYVSTLQYGMYKP